MESLFYMLTFIALVHALPAPVREIQSDNKITEIAMTERIRNSLNSPEYSKTSIEQAQKIVPAYYGMYFILHLFH